MERKFVEDECKDYVLLTAEHFVEPKENIELKGCRNLHMIAFHPDLAIQMRLFICSCEQCSQGNLVRCSNDETLDLPTLYTGKTTGKTTGKRRRSEDDVDDDHSEDDADGPDELTDDEEDDLEKYELVVDAIQVGSHVAIHSSVNSLEIFFLCKVTVGLKYTEEDIADFFGHCIPSGQQYFTCKYLELVDSMPRKGFYKYKILKRDVYLTPCQVFSIDVKMKDEKFLAVSEFQFLADSIM